MVHEALVALSRAGVLHWGNESPEAQFFVMKYGDQFTQDGILAYAMAVKSFAEKGLAENRMSPAEYEGWMEWHKEVLVEAEAAQVCNHRLPT